METINKFDTLIVNFENDVRNYVTITNAGSPELADNVKSIRAWVDEQKASGDEAKTLKNIENAEKVVQTSIAAISDLKHGKYLEGGLKIVSSVALLVGGPYGAPVGAICGMLTSVLSASSPSQPDPATQLSNIVHEELRKFNQVQKTERLAGLLTRVGHINIALKNIKEEAKGKPLWWMSGVSKNPANYLKIPDEELFLSTFPQFIGEVGSKMNKGLTLESSQAEANDCIASLVSYCKAQTLYVILLTNVLATFEMTGHNTKNIIEVLELRKNDARTRLDMIVIDGDIPSQRGRMAMFYHLRKNMIAYNVVKCFRESLEMSPIPDVEEARQQAEVAAGEMPEDISIGYPKPEMKGDSDYFQLINHTNCPIKVCIYVCAYI